jgi:hypothetical protein
VEQDSTVFASAAAIASAEASNPDVKVKTEPGTFYDKSPSPNGINWTFADPSDRRSCQCVSAKTRSSPAAASGANSGKLLGSTKPNSRAPTHSQPSTVISTNPSLNVWGESIRKHLGGEFETNSTKNTKDKSLNKPRKYGGAFHRRLFPSADVARSQTDPFSTSFSGFLNPYTPTYGTTGGYGAVNFQNYSLTGFRHHAQPNYFGDLNGKQEAAGEANGEFSLFY